MVKVDKDSMDAQSSSVSTAVSQEVTTLTAGMTALNQFLAADSLKGSAYDNAKSYASNVLLPLIQAVILYAESVSEKTSSLGTLYASYSDESLDSEVLESQIRQHENSWRSTNAMYELLLQDEGSGASSTQRLLSSMDSMQSEIRELREKLRKLNEFNTATFQTFADTATLEGTLLTAFNQVKQDFGSYTPGKGFPSYNKKNLDWAQGVDSQWGKRQQVIQDYDDAVKKAKNGQDLTEDDIVAIAKYVQKHPNAKLPQSVLDAIEDLEQKKRNHVQTLKALDGTSYALDSASYLYTGVKGTAEAAEAYAASSSAWKASNSWLKNMKDLKDIAKNTDTVKIASKYDDLVGNVAMVGALIDGYSVYDARAKDIGKGAALVDGAVHATASGTGAIIGGMLGTLLPIPGLGTVLGAYAGTIVGNFIGNIYDSTVRGEEFDWGENFNPFGNDGAIRK